MWRSKKRKTTLMGGFFLYIYLEKKYEHLTLIIFSNNSALYNYEDFNKMK
jgi:hypothetical protein